MYKVMIGLVRRDDMSKEQFIAWWTREHAPRASTLPDVQRIRFNVMSDGPFDGIAELWFASEQAMTDAYASDIGATVAADSMAHVSSRVRMIADEHEIFG